MKILLVIDDLGSGGAQRQISNLALALHSRGIDVAIALYHDSGHDIFRAGIEARGIPIFAISKPLGFSPRVPAALATIVKEYRYDVVISALHGPNFYCELARLARPSVPLIVSERSHHVGESNRLVGVMRRVMHAMASAVVCNSESQADWLRQFPWLKRKVLTIYNGYPGFEFTPLVPPGEGTLRLLAIGRISQEKNPKMLALALAEVHRRTGKMPRLVWVGRVEGGAASQAYHKEVCDFIDGHAVLKENWIWAGEQSNVQPFLTESHALIHTASFEGLPNVVCEALMAARPVLTSNVSDNARLVAHGERGLVLPALTYAAIADAVQKLGHLPDTTWLEWSRNSRSFAIEHLTIDRMCDEYLEIVDRVRAKAARQP